MTKPNKKSPHWHLIEELKKDNWDFIAIGHTLVIDEKDDEETSDDPV